MLQAIKSIFMLFMLLLCLGCTALSLSQPQERKAITEESDILVLVVHQANTIENLSRLDIKSIYLKKKRNWEDGKPILCLDFPAKTEERESFSFAIFQKNSYLMQKYWIHVVERGFPAKPPMEIARANRILAFIHSNPNAIGYVRLSHFKYFQKQKKYKIKYIKINDISPSLEEAQKGQYILTLREEK